MVKISIADLKIFFSKAQGIKQNGILPILDYLMISCKGDVCTITKNAQSAFIVHTIPAKFNKEFVILVDEKNLQNSVNASDQDVIKISFKDRKVQQPGGGYNVVKVITLEDGHLIDTSFESADEALYPATPVVPKEGKVTFTPDIVESLYTAASHASPAKAGGIMTWEAYTHVKNVAKKKSYVFGFNKMAMYYKSFKETLPDMSLEPAVCNIIGLYQATGVDVVKGENYIFVDTGISLYGFSQTTIVAPDVQPIIEKMDTTKQFSIDRKSLLSWCNYAVKMNPYQETEPCTMKNGEGDKQVIFDYQDDKTNLSLKAPFEIKKSKRYAIPKFLFSPSDLMTVLKGCTFEKVNLVGPCDGNLYVTCDDDPEYVGAVRMIVMSNEIAQEVKNEQ